MWAIGVEIKRHRRGASSMTCPSQVAADSDVIAGGTKVPARGSVVDRLPGKTCKA